MAKIEADDAFRVLLEKGGLALLLSNSIGMASLANVGQWGSAIVAAAVTSLTDVGAVRQYFGSTGLVAS